MKHKVAELEGALLDAAGAALDDQQMTQLGEHIAMPDWEKRLVPLFQFRGTKPHRIRALWNAAFGMYLGEAETVNEGARMLARNPAEHLCGLHRTPQRLEGFFSRLHACKPLTDSVSKEFTEYIRWVFPNPLRLEHVPLQAHDFREGVTAWWRTGVAKKIAWKSNFEVKPAERQYPYITRGGHKEHELLMSVHSHIPSTVPHAIRGDLCQDLIVAVLSGDITVENIPDSIAKYIREAKKVMPDIWRQKTISLDEVVPGTDGLRLIDSHLMHARRQEDFSPELIEAIDREERHYDTPAVHWRAKGIDPTKEITSTGIDWKTGQVVRLKADALRRLGMVAQGRFGFREGVVTGHTDSGEFIVAFAATEDKKATTMSAHWNWLEPAHVCGALCQH